MSTLLSRSGRPSGWLVIAIAICVAVPALMTLEGCCSWCTTHCSPPPLPTRVHVVTVVADDGRICVVPEMTKAKRGDWVLFVNASQKPVTIKPAVDYQVFDQGNEATLLPNESKKLKIRDNAPLGAFSLDVSGFDCDGYPGPGMDVEG